MLRCIYEGCGKCTGEVGGRGDGATKIFGINLLLIRVFILKVE